MKLDEPAHGADPIVAVIPAKAGIQYVVPLRLDRAASKYRVTRFRG